MPDEDLASNRVEEYDDQVNALGDQDAINTGYQYPADAHTPSAENVRRYPELFAQEVIDSFNTPNPDHESGNTAVDVDDDVAADDNPVEPGAPSGEPLDATTITNPDADNADNADNADSGDHTDDSGSSTRVSG